MSKPSREQAAQELRTCIAVVSATQEHLAGRMPEPQYLAVLDGLAADTYAGAPGGPLAIIPGLAYVALRLAALHAQQTGRSVELVLAELGREAATEPPTGVS